MTELIDFSLIIAIVVNGIHLVFTPNNLLEKAGLWMEDNLHEYICKMLFACPTCMGGIYSIITFYFCFGKYDIRIIAIVPATICLATLISTFLDIVNVLRDIEDKFPKEQIKRKKK